MTAQPTPAPTIAYTSSPATLAPVVPPIGISDLTSPPELEWTMDADSGVFNGELDFGVVTLDNFWGETLTRGYNGMVRQWRGEGVRNLRVDAVIG